MHAHLVIASSDDKVSVYADIDYGFTSCVEISISCSDYVFYRRKRHCRYARTISDSLTGFLRINRGASKWCT